MKLDGISVEAAGDEADNAWKVLAKYMRLPSFWDMRKVWTTTQRFREDCTNPQIT